MSDTRLDTDLRGGPVPIHVSGSTPVSKGRALISVSDKTGLAELVKVGMGSTFHLCKFADHQGGASLSQHLPQLLLRRSPKTPSDCLGPCIITCPDHQHVLYPMFH